MEVYKKVVVFIFTGMIHLARWSSCFSKPKGLARNATTKVMPLLKMLYKGTLQDRRATPKISKYCIAILTIAETFKELR